MNSDYYSRHQFKPNQTVTAIYLHQDQTFTCPPSHHYHFSPRMQPRPHSSQLQLSNSLDLKPASQKMLESHKGTRGELKRRRRMKNEQTKKKEKKDSRQERSLQKKLMIIQTKINSIKKVIQTTISPHSLKRGHSDPILKNIKVDNWRGTDPFKKKNQPTSQSQEIKKAQRRTIKKRFYTSQVLPKRPAPVFLDKHDQLPSSSSLYYVTQLVKAVKGDKDPQALQHITQTLFHLQRLKFIRKPLDHETQSRRLILSQDPKHKGKKTLVLDLDETLIHCVENVSSPHDVKVVVPIHGQEMHAGINIRPMAQQFLQKMSQMFEIMIFTASYACYADKVLQQLDPDNQFISHRLYRESCFFSQGYYIKDLRIINRKLSDLVLVDNAVYSYYFQPDNGIPILPYHKGKSDLQLQHLMEYLIGLQKSKDVRERNRGLLKLSKYENYNSSLTLVEELYHDQDV